MLKDKNKTSIIQSIEVSQIRSVIGKNKKKYKILRALGLKKIGSKSCHRDNNCIRGMLNKVVHFVEYKIVD